MKRNMRTIISCLLAWALVPPSFGMAAALPSGGTALVVALKKRG